MPFSLSLPLVFRLWALYILALGIYKLLGLPYCGTLLHLPLHLTPIPPLFFCSLFAYYFSPDTFSSGSVQFVSKQVSYSAVPFTVVFGLPYVHVMLEI